MGAIPLSPHYIERGPAIISLRQPPGRPAGHPALLSVRSVPTPSKVSPGKYQDLYPTLHGHHHVLLWTDLYSGLTGQCGALALLQRSSGCRISEALALSTTDVVLPDLLIIKALKGSRARSVRIPELQSQLLSLLSAGSHPLFRLSYAQVYRQYKAAGIIEYLDHNHRNRVTHSLRHAYIQNIQLVSKDVGITADIVGHKSKRSTLIYLKKGTTNG